jgi:hypothetical protein
LQIEDQLERLHAGCRQQPGRQPLGVTADALDFDDIASPEMLEPGFEEGSLRFASSTVFVLIKNGTRIVNRHHRRRPGPNVSMPPHAPKMANAAGASAPCPKMATAATAATQMMKATIME